MKEFLQGKSGEALRRYKKPLLWLAATTGILALASVLVWFFVSPYDTSIDKTESFYVSENAPSRTSARATVVAIEGGKGSVKIEDGARRGLIVDVTFISVRPTPGDRVLVDMDRSGLTNGYATEFWRIPGIALLTFLFILLVVIVGGKQGLMSIVGLATSVLVIAAGLIPAVLNGVNAFWACVAAAFAIAIISVVVAHGWRWRTGVSLLSILFILCVAVGFALLGGWLGHLTGIYDETSSLLATTESAIDLRGVLVGGIIIATLGVLDDIVTAQTAAIDELHKAQPKLTFSQLFTHGRSVGREHVASLVNTLALAYIGVSLPIVLSMVLNFDPTRSILLLFNSEFISQEIIRTLVSSMALVIAVPAATAIGAFLILHKNQIFATLKRSKPKSGGQ